MSPPKPALQSRTIQGALAGTLAGAFLFLAPHMGVELPPEIQDALLLAMLGAFGVTVQGRQRADRPVSWKRKGS
jgi:hypothetical protein